MSRAVLELRVPVSAPPADVFAAITDWPRQSEWMLGTEVHVTAGDGRSVGSALAAFTGFGGLGFLDTMEITRWEPPRRCEVRHTGRFVRGKGVFDVLPGPGEHAVFRWVEELDLPFGGLGRLGWFVVRPAFAWGVRQSLDRFRRYCEENAGREDR